MHVDWPHYKAEHPLMYSGSSVTAALIERMQRRHFAVSENVGLLDVAFPGPCRVAGERAPCFLFARKFAPSSVSALMSLRDTLGSFLAAPVAVGLPKLEAAPARRNLTVRAGTKILRNVKVVELFGEDKTGGVRGKVVGSDPEIRLLSRVEDLRLLSKAEQAGLLSLAESFGLSLTAIEELGLLSKAEEFGILSAATDRSTPGTLQAIAFLLLLAGPAFVYFVPDDSTGLIVAQVVVSLLCAFGGAAAFGAGQLLASLQKK
ncbi:unnamed protein product [Closterium sp. NIES-64]|nr:unnamed protein product [Closterium sp. NIES-64]